MLSYGSMLEYTRNGRWYPYSAVSNAIARCPP